jgi:pimeloyl-ACP methyl ester carboxylesterase
MVRVVGDVAFDLGDVVLRAKSDGPTDGPLALCLHGFPDTPHTFRLLTPHLVAQGYRVVAPFTRGYAPSSTSKTDNYQLAALTHDAQLLHDRLGADERAVLIGHDWGASVGYVAAGVEPSRWSKVVTMAVPPLLTFVEALGTYDQLKMSWYMFFFQSPLAEGAVASDDYEFLRRLRTTWSPALDVDADHHHVVDALGESSHLSAALGYYRAMFSGASPVDAELQAIAASAMAPPRVPVLYLHGAKDGAIAPMDDARVRAALGERSRYELVADAGHFLHLEQPELVHQLIDEFLAN